MRELLPRPHIPLALRRGVMVLGVAAVFGMGIHETVSTSGEERASHRKACAAQLGQYATLGDIPEACGRSQYQENFIYQEEEETYIRPSAKDFLAKATQADNKEELAYSQWSAIGGLLISASAFALRWRRPAVRQSRAL